MTRRIAKLWGFFLLEGGEGEALLGLVALFVCLFFLVCLRYKIFLEEITTDFANPSTLDKSN